MKKQNLTIEEISELNGLEILGGSTNDTVNNYCTGDGGNHLLCVNVHCSHGGCTHTDCTNTSCSHAKCISQTNPGPEILVVCK